VIVDGFLTIIHFLISYEKYELIGSIRLSQRLYKKYIKKLKRRKKRH